MVSIRFVTIRIISKPRNNPRLFNRTLLISRTQSGPVLSSFSRFVALRLYRSAFTSSFLQRLWIEALLSAFRLTRNSCFFTFLFPSTVIRTGIFPFRVKKIFFDSESKKCSVRLLLLFDRNVDNVPCVSTMPNWVFKM